MDYDTIFKLIIWLHCPREPTCKKKKLHECESLATESETDDFAQSLSHLYKIAQSSITFLLLATCC